NQLNGNKEMISLKGSRGLGTDFFVPIPNSVATMTQFADAGVGFDVVATQTGVTTVLISPMAACVAHGKNMTFAKTLAQGQTFSVKDLNSVNPSQLGGSIVSSDKPIAVTIRGSVTNTACSSYYLDQIVPTSKLGKDYVILKGNGIQDVAYILAPQNATGFTVTTSSGSFNWLVNASETYSVDITSPITYVKANKPFYLFHLSGYGCKMSGTQLAPVYCAGSYSAAFTRLTSDSLNLNICTRAGYQNSFTLTSNGSNIPISSASFSTVPGSSGALVAGRIYLPTSSVSVGSYNLLSNSADIFDLGVINGGYTVGSVYSQATDFDIKSFAHANAIPTATICGNTQFTLNGSVGGGPNTGVWSILQGYGSLSGSVSQLTNNIYTPSLLDTVNNLLSISPGNRYVKIILTSTGICPVATDTLKLHVKQPPIVTAGASSIICSNNPSVQLNGNVYGATNQGVWNVVLPGNGTFTAGVGSFTTIYALSQSDVLLNQLKFVLTSTNNGVCNAENDTVQIFINHPPTISASTINPISRCSNNATISLNGIITGTTTSSGMWTSSGSGVFLPNNVALNTNYIPSLNDVTFGSIWLRLESTNNGLCFAVRDSFQVLFTNPSLANAGGDVNSCKNDPRASLNGIITGTVTNTGVWSGGGGTYLPSNSVLNATYVATPAEVSQGFVTLTLSTTNNGLCLSTNDEVKVNFQEKPFANFSVNEVCLGQFSSFKDQSINLSQSGLLKSWTWNFGDNSTGSQNISPLHTYSNVGVFTATLIVKNTFNCADTVEKPVTIYDLPAADFLINRACSGSAQNIIFIDNSSVSQPSTINPNGYYWDFGGYGFANSKDTSVVFPSEGLYSITHVVTSDKGCQAAISKSVNITPRPVAKFVNISNSVPGLASNVSFVDTSLYATTWTWDFGNGETSTIKNPFTSYAQNGTYVVSLTVTDQFGCPNTYTSEVRVSTIVSDLVKLIPNVITPNNDGKNDLWRMEFLEVFFPDVEIEIYNRWGVRLFRSVGYSNAWDGSYLGSPLPVGAYFYTINLHDKDQTPVIKGTVTIVK
ncbi:MAG: gliding motility-associated C-terminal domain-containing protein, partial [Bacteroidia bacterium]|nr:gliding motility-associated C-terminal domain-containing protein [Bacteroidia bacterium]